MCSIYATSSTRVTTLARHTCHLATTSDTGTRPPLVLTRDPASDTRADNTGLEVVRDRDWDLDIVTIPATALVILSIKLSSGPSDQCHY